MFARWVVGICAMALVGSSLRAQGDVLDSVLASYYGSNCEDQLQAIAKEHGLVFRYESRSLFGRFGNLALRGLTVREGLDLICAWTRTSWTREGPRTIRITER